MEFKSSPNSTIGIEIELQLLDPKTLDLVDGILPLIKSYPQHPFTKPEYNQATVEINSKVCFNIEVHSLIVYLQHYHEDRENGFLLIPHHWWLEKENYFRASRLGLEADYIEEAWGKSRPMKQVIADILDSLKTTAAQLGETEYLQLVRERLEGTPSYIRQRRVWQTTGSQQAVVASLVRELKQEMGGSLVPGITQKL